MSLAFREKHRRATVPLVGNTHCHTYHGTSPIEIDEPVLPDADDEIPLKRIFHGIEQEGSGHHLGNINVQSQLLKRKIC